MKITTGYVNYIYKKYKENGEYKINNKRKSKEIVEITKIIEKDPLSGLKNKKIP